MNTQETEALLTSNEELLGNNTQFLSNTPSKNDEFSNIEEENSIQKQSKKRQKSKLPFGDLEILSISQTVKNNWEEEKFPLLWTNKVEFEEKLEEYNTQIRTLSEDGGTKRTYIKELKILDEEINEKVTKLKSAILAKYGKKFASSYYAKFGIVDGKFYRLPNNRESRLNNLKTLVNSIKEDKDLILYDFGQEYWENLLLQYENLYKQSISGTGTLSQIVGNKNQNKEYLKNFLNCIIYLLKANYPLTWQNELRAYGFQKERY